MTINVKYNYGWPEPVCVIVEGYCNHAAYDEEVDEFVSPSASNSYQSAQDRIEVCRKCKAWRFAAIDTEDYFERFDWQGITAMPEIWKGFTR